MAAATATPTAIKSIDVGSMFLMDLALSDEAELLAPANGAPSSFSTTYSNPLATQPPTETIFHEPQQQQQQQQDLRRDQLTRSQPMDAIFHHHDNQPAAGAQLTHLDELEDVDQDYIISYVHNQRGNYCRLLKNIQGCYLNAELHGNLWNQVKPQHQHTSTSNTTTGREHAGRSSSSSSSLSDLSLTGSHSDGSSASSSSSSDSGADSSSSGSVISYSVINKYTSADDAGRTRSINKDEDSGIVGMKQLEERQPGNRGHKGRANSSNNNNNSYDIEDYFQHQHQRFHPQVTGNFGVDEDTMMMMMDIEPASDSARIHLNDSSYSERDNNKPTKNSHYHNNYYNRGTDSRRFMSASLPIQVPPRQSDRDSKSSYEAAEASDFEEFLDQEYNRSSHYY